MQIFNVSENIVVANANRVTGNMTCINTDEGLIFVDSGLFVKKAALFRKDMEKKFKKKTIHLILTHNHQDHIFGMDAFSDIPITASNKTIETITKRIPTDFTSEGIAVIAMNYVKAKGFFMMIGVSEEEVYELKDLSDVKIKIPTIGFDKLKTITSKSGDIIISLSGGHTEDSSYVYLPNQKVLITGDEFYHTTVPLFAGVASNFKNWHQALKKWQEMDIQTVIPGHGTPIEFDYLKKAVEFVDNTVQTLIEHKKSNNNVQKVLEDERLENFYGYSAWKGTDWWKESLKKLYEIILEGEY